MADESGTPQADPHLLQLILSLETAAMQQMGKLQNPFTGKIERDLELAKNSIDMLGMIERKTEGNLASEEKSMIERALYQLRMNYIDELKADEAAESAQPDEKAKNEDSEPESESEAEEPEPEKPEQDQKHDV